MAEGVVESSTPQIVIDEGVGLISGYAFSKTLGSCAYGVNGSGDTRQTMVGLKEGEGREGREDVRAAP